MSANEFVFALELSDAARFDAMLIEVAQALLGSVALTGAPLATVAAVLRQAVSSGADRGHHRCDVRFQAHAGELRIAVAYAGQPEWHTTVALPNP